MDEVVATLANKLDVQRPQNAPVWPAVLENLRSRQRLLILLDNFESIWSSRNEELRDASEVFLAQLAALDELTLLVTTRGNVLPESCTWANIDTAELDTLSSTAARMTFNDLTCLKPRILESGPEANALTELLREIDFMPLAITLLARLDDLPSLLLREWSEHYTAVLETDHHDGTRRELSVEVSIKISLAHLPAESVHVRPRQLLSALGQLPAGLFSDVSTELQSTIPNIDLAAQDLLHHSLVYLGVHGELRMLSPVRHYVSASLPILDATLSALDKIYIAIANARPASDRMYSDGPAYDVELPNAVSILISTLDRRSDGEPVRAILTLSPYCAAREQPCLPLLRKLLPRLGHSCIEKAQCEMSIGYHYRFSADPGLGIPFLERAAELFAELGEKQFEARCREGLAQQLRGQGLQESGDQQAAKAEILLRESSSYGSYLEMAIPGEDAALIEQQFRDARDDRIRVGDVIAVCDLSDRILEILYEQGDTVALIKELELVVALEEQMQPASTLLGMTKIRLAEQYLHCDNPDTAERLLIEACALMTQHNYHEGLVSVTCSLAHVRVVQCRFSEGAELLEAAARLCRERGIETDATDYDTLAKKMWLQAKVYQ